MRLAEQIAANYENYRKQISEENKRIGAQLELEYKASIFYGKIEELKYEIDSLYEIIRKGYDEIYCRNLSIEQVIKLTMKIEQMEKAIKVLEKRNKIK